MACQHAAKYGTKLPRRVRRYLSFSGAMVVFEEPSGAGCMPGGV
jgi:hypothetical protein